MVVKVRTNGDATVIAFPWRRMIHEFTATVSGDAVTLTAPDGVTIGTTKADGREVSSMCVVEFARDMVSWSQSKS